VGIRGCERAGSRVDRRGGRQSWSAFLIPMSLSLLVSLASGCGDDESADVPEEPAFTAVAVLDGASAGRSIWVRVLDRNAEPIDGASVSIELPTGGVRDATEVAVGQHRLDGLIDGIVPIAVDVAGRRHMLEHPVAKPNATLVLPVGGRLDVVWQVPQLADLPEGELHLIVAARADPELRFELEVEPEEGYVGRELVPYLLPGQYLASLELWRVPDAPVAERVTPYGPPSEGEGPVKILPLTQPRLLSIEEGEVTQIVLGGPSLTDGQATDARP